MGAVKQRGELWTVEICKKKGGAIIHYETKSWKGPKAEQLARDWEKRTEAAIAKHGIPQRKSSIVTLGELIQRYGETLAKVKEIGRSRESHLVKLAVEFSDVKLDTITPHTFTKYAEGRRASGAGPATVMQDLSVVRGALGVAKVMYGIDVNADPVKEAMAVLSKMKIIAKARKRTRRPTMEELKALENVFKKMQGHPSCKIPMHQIMWVAIELPRRIGELTAMLWEDLNDNVIVLRDTKNPIEPRTEYVPVLPKAAELIAALPIIDERILPYNEESVSASWQRACKKLLIEDLHFHDLRREGVSRLFEAGYAIPEVAKVSGHLDWSMLKIYTEISAKNVLEKFT